MQPFGRNGYGTKIGGVPLWGGGAGSPSNTICPGPRPTYMTSFILIRLSVWPQYTNVTDRRGQTDTTVRQHRANRFTGHFGRSWGSGPLDLPGQLYAPGFKISIRYRLLLAVTEDHCFWPRGLQHDASVRLWRSDDPPGHMSILLTNSRVEGGVGLTWEAGSACLKKAGRRQSNRF